MNRRDRRDAADLLRGVLDAVERGELRADSPAAVATVRRLEGALLALEALDLPLLKRRSTATTAGGEGDR